MLVEEEISEVYLIDFLEDLFVFETLNIEKWVLFLQGEDFFLFLFLNQHHFLRLLFLFSLPFIFALFDCFFLFLGEICLLDFGLEIQAFCFHFLPLFFSFLLHFLSLFSLFASLLIFFLYFSFCICGLLFLSLRSFLNLLHVLFDLFKLPSFLLCHVVGIEILTHLRLRCFIFRLPFFLCLFFHNLLILFGEIDSNIQGLYLCFLFYLFDLLFCFIFLLGFFQCSLYSIIFVVLVFVFGSIFLFAEGFFYDLSHD